MISLSILSGQAGGAQRLVYWTESNFDSRVGDIFFKEHEVITAKSYITTVQ